MSVLLGDMIVRINEQFRTLINFLADTANDIAQTLTDVVDVVAGVLTLGTSTTLTIISILADFAHNVANLVTDSMVHISEFQSAAQKIKTAISGVTVPRPLPAGAGPGAGPAGQWKPLNP